ncbi:hypothetical protein SAMN05443575_2344 [Jatrophihabitans endophyticus]|uniref:Uncharacterized protein n=1 Tax=Jatrophihabitans endophyticus TaxID=1206085 RepID=A0A1M5L449_9ACTN|nr:hypothetical protein [Jatrophihabitans endophyticus]SHG59715.1 hypothetical protein SAMN05443575_2344 [Jatrophihabitans endophyticus]
MADARGPFGELGDDARSLLTAMQDAVQQWSQRNLPAPPSGHGGPECQWCPLCQFASMLRGENPDVADRLVEAGSALAAALRALLDSTAWRPAGSAGLDPRPDATRDRPRPAPRVQHIRLDDEPGDGGR